MTRWLSFVAPAAMALLSSCYAEPVPACTQAAPFLRRAAQSGLNTFELRPAERQVVENAYNSSFPATNIHLSHVFLIDDGHDFALLFVVPGDCIVRYQSVTLGQLRGISRDAAAGN